MTLRRGWGEPTRHAADQAALYQALTTLPLTYRRVLTLRFRDNCSLADTALQLGLSPVLHHQSKCSISALR
ncbi:sigma factor-like helix-turn-helix DNA-binding protein [Chloroflexus sp.]|uniref:sigma factor-like helix-turn-helix DNA-binding protein n=1 Tax=Chloroflexus sp. TaxID=1904827 RepID=UPI002582D2AB|nr:sigma factor-like helix-turn-helix DNA-binding protein [Chloroflexus sp.]